MNIVAPFGFYGWGNIGDEATLRGFAKLVDSRDPRPSVWVASRNPGHTKRVVPSFAYFRADRDGLRKRWAFHRASAVVFAGGTPLMDSLGYWPLSEVASLVAAARNSRKPVVFVGIGSERLQRAESQRLVRKELASQVAYWTVRSERDLQRLVDWGVPRDRASVAADLAWLLPPESADFGMKALTDLGLELSHPLIGININAEPAMLREEPCFLEKVAALADSLSRVCRARILFFCSEVREDEIFDKAAAGKVLAMMRRHDRAAMLPNRYLAPDQLASVIACCDLVVSTRYHVCLLSALQRIPFFALQRSDKVRDLCADLCWPFGTDLNALKADVLVDRACEIMATRQELSVRLGEATKRQAQRSLVNNLALCRLETGK